MSGALLFWMILLLGGIFGPFIFFANTAAKHEKTKS